MIDGVGGGKKSGEKKFFFSDVAKKIRENVVEKCGEVIEKKLAEKKLVKKFHFSSTTTNQSIR